jgi:hypothetical protein
MAGDYHDGAMETRPAADQAGRVTWNEWLHSGQRTAKVVEAWRWTVSRVSVSIVVSYVTVIALTVVTV